MLNFLGIMKLEHVTKRDVQEFELAIHICIYIYMYMYICIYIYIWLCALVTQKFASSSL